MRRRTVTGLTAIAIAFTQIALAADPVVATLTAARVTKQTNGQEKLASADQAKPGDVLEYRVDYHNSTQGAIGNLVATLPIPPNGVDFLPGTDQPRGAQASLDGQTFAPIPLMRTVKLADGRTVKQPVPTTEYRFLRWSLGALPAAAHKTVSARVRLTDTSTVQNSTSTSGNQP